MSWLCYNKTLFIKAGWMEENLIPWPQFAKLDPRSRLTPLLMVLLGCLLTTQGVQCSNLFWVFGWQASFNLKQAMAIIYFIVSAPCLSLFPNYLLCLTSWNAAQTSKDPKAQVQSSLQCSLTSCLLPHSMFLRAPEALYPKLGSLLPWCTVAGNCAIRKINNK